MRYPDLLKAKQKNLRVFEITVGEHDELVAYIEKNFILLREYLLILDGKITQQTQEYLNSKNLCFLDKENCISNTVSNKNSQKNIAASENDDKNVQNDQKTSCNSHAVVYNRPIRSGEEIITDQDVVIFGRINSGAKVITEGNLQLFGDLDGIVQADGNFMLLKKIGLGNAVFNGEILDKDKFDGSLKKITLANGNAVIEDI